MAKSALSSDTLPKAGRVNAVCREWLVHEDGALAYRLQDAEIKEHYMGNKVRNAQVREDLPRAKVEQELEALRYQTYVQQQEERDALVARQIALSLEREERQRERELQERMRLQLRLDDEAVQLEIERRIQEEKDEELARKLQEAEEEEEESGAVDFVDEQLLIDRKIAMEAQDAELARMLQEKERAKARKARERAKQRKLERQQLRQLEEQTVEEQKRRQQQQLRRPDKLDLESNEQGGKSKAVVAATATAAVAMRHRYNYPEYADPEEIRTLEKQEVEEEPPLKEIRDVPNVATIIDPTYNARSCLGAGVSCNSSDTVAAVAVPVAVAPSSQEPFDAPYYMPVQGQRRNQMQSPSQMHEEKHKRRVKDGCKHQ